MTETRYTIRGATAEDAEFLTDMLVEAVNWSAAREPVGRRRILTEHELAHYVTGWPRPGDLGAVAVGPDGRPVGAGWLRRFDAQDPGYGFVAPDVPEVSLGVVADWRGRGVGRALLRELARRAAEAGISRLSLSVERANRAVRLYEDEGFARVESGPDADTMVKELR
ncbi:GNAT family N-acetyltransferase [Streptomyces sp. ACA25]|uniref:GNAT family N-acetyltransferase n=1 Tax=Streptomyces sp. ACA25 TaxID=3022596 RepID=UPI0023076FC2|nr:GNAT family N-acetyltransferase [Streptomyces sp. ACA25]MDB1088078.1 GNAT family N-acetyltransferase [Streptomyces sp. ACA25]